jgi:hypothetical protein
MGDMISSVLMIYGDAYGTNGYHTVMYKLYDIALYKGPELFKVCFAS